MFLFQRWYRNDDVTQKFGKTAKTPFPDEKNLVTNVDPEAQDPNYYHTLVSPYYANESAKRSLEAEYPDVELSTDEWNYVEAVLPRLTVPEPPQHEAFPTPSGWVPPKGLSVQMEKVTLKNV